MSNVARSGYITAARPIAPWKSFYRFLNFRAQIVGRSSDGAGSGNTVLLPEHETQHACCFAPDVKKANLGNLHFGQIALEEDGAFRLTVADFQENSNARRLYKPPPPPSRPRHHPSPRRTNTAPRHPRALPPTDHPHHRGRLIHIRGPAPQHARRPHHLLPIDPRPNLGQRRITEQRKDDMRHVARYAIVQACACHGPHRHRVHRGALSELARPHARHGFQRALAAGVGGRVLQPHRRADAGDVDDAPGPVGGQVGDRGGDEQRGASRVEVERPVVRRRCQCLQGLRVGHARVVDDDVDLEATLCGLERRLCRLDELARAPGGGEVGLRDDGCYAVGGFQLGGYGLGFGLGAVGGVVHHDVGAFGG
ncbi:hypothetical protein B5807_07349 [Epicoccum nigrum]|uniref:Uncharacterized protein n=1 Tax=Epicoccum nigrum TaxID=105696 RepID=A0A1Y2LV58_EPING|nr:hypothetical protein B5807_07349 [Epicoccum nigrum]